MVQFASHIFSAMYTQHILRGMLCMLSLVCCVCACICVPPISLYDSQTDVETQESSMTSLSPIFFTLLPR